MRKILFPAPNTAWNYEELEQNLIWIPHPKENVPMEEIKKYYTDNIDLSQIHHSIIGNTYSY